jgi:hypothetical protein
MSGERIGHKYIGSTSTKELFKTPKGPDDVISCHIKGAQALTLLKGYAMVDDAANAGYKKRYKNATNVASENVGSGDGSTTTFDLANDNVVANSIRAWDAAGDQIPCSISVGTGAAGVDQVVFDKAPASGAINVTYKHHENGIAGPCVLMDDVTVTTSMGDVSADGARDGVVDTSLVLDSADAEVDDYFKDALKNMSFD